MNIEKSLEIHKNKLQAGGPTVVYWAEAGHGPGEPVCGFSKNVNGDFGQKKKLPNRGKFYLFTVRNMYF